MPGFYTPNLKREDKIFQISGEEFHHLIHVRRRGVGDHITLTNGSGLLGEGIISEITKKNAIVDITKIKEVRNSLPRIAVAFSLLKSKNDLLIIEKLTELGVREFFPMITERSVRKISSNTVDKFRKVSIAAIKQCDNAYLPEINEPLEMIKVLKFISRSGFIPLVAMEAGDRMDPEQVFKHISDQDHCLVIGPEGGFSPAEIQYINENDIICTTLGNHILRAETAAITAAALFLNFQLRRDPEYY